MGLKKGTTNNPNGRPAGTPNVITKEIRDILKQIMLREFELIPATLEGMEPKERLDMIVKLLPFILPKIDPVQMTEGEPWDSSNI